MLARVIGFGVGGFLLGAGLYEAVMPGHWSAQADRLVDDFVPEPTRTAAKEFTSLSPDAVRLMGIGKVIVGWLMVKMAF